MIEKSEKRYRLLAALSAAVWREDGGNLSVGHPEPDPKSYVDPDFESTDDNMLYVDGMLDLDLLVDAVIAALDAPPVPVEPKVIKGKKEARPTVR